MENAIFVIFGISAFCGTTSLNFRKCFPEIDVFHLICTRIFEKFVEWKAPQLEYNKNIAPFAYFYHAVRVQKAHLECKMQLSLKENTKR